MLLGTFHTSIDVEGMNLYMDLKEKGIDDTTAKVAGISGGILNGALEVCSFGVMTAPIKSAAKKAAAKKSAPKTETPVEPTPQVEAVPQTVEAEVVTEEDFDLGLDSAQPNYTLDDVRDAISKFISSFENVTDGKKATLEILKKYNYAKIPEIAEKDFASIIGEVSKGGK